MGSRAALLSTNDMDEEKDLQSFIRGVICLAYPLHPVNQRTNLRSEPLTQLVKPVIFVSGDQDQMAYKPVFENVLKTMQKGKILFKSKFMFESVLIHGIF